MNTCAWPWVLVCAGQFVAVFALAALSGPGRIDIVDGQTRYEVARSVVEHGDVKIRDERVWFLVFPGRDGARYTKYRLPQSVLGVAAITLADATGPATEPRRRFCFVLTSAFACALVSVAFALWFRRTVGQTFLSASPAADRNVCPTSRSAVAWALLGIVATPCWFYGTSTFDDILGTAGLVWAVVLAYLSREHRPLLGAAAAGLLLGWTFHCKEPLGVFVLAVLAANLDWRRPLRAQWPRVALIVGGLALGVATYQAYEAYKFPPEATANHAELLRRYVPYWTANPLPALAAFTLSPGAGVLWYCPPLLLCLVGLYRWCAAEPWLCRAVVVGCVVFIGFLSFLTFFNGDPAWGPRYLTPLFALLWLFAPAGAAVLRPLPVRALLVLGVVVQLLGLSVDPHRLFLARNLPSAFYHNLPGGPWLYFDANVSQLVNRPRLIGEILQSNGEQEVAFTPGPEPTFAFPVLDFVDRADSVLLTSTVGLAAGLPLTSPAVFLTRDLHERRRTDAVHRYHVLNSFRPWWANQWYLPPAARPVDLAATAALLAALLLGGLGAVTLGLRVARNRLPPPEPRPMFEQPGKAGTEEALSP